MNGLQDSDVKVTPKVRKEIQAITLSQDMEPVIQYGLSCNDVVFEKTFKLYCQMLILTGGKSSEPAATQTLIK
jgi:hypothetical protein